ncbi:MAG: OmpA family protein [Flavobacteriales bacterium]|nr:OmpA family protein [Flavobacteriales bacterium]MBW7854233.1 OmpA family protein [Candidatus Kapabacteria bacterium]MCC6330634.1 OmpA family protein [Ignavibacteria bacterium]NOG66606.1 OmpA family protein [Chlorobiota bacterium]MBZ0195149.1 OmpA family protein [Candidatus Kapabacteria bacterium]
MYCLGQTNDSLEQAALKAEKAKIQSSLEGLRLIIQNVDISKFPQIKLIVEAYDDSSRVLERIDPKTLTVMEDGVEKPVISIEKITITERIPVDFVFLVDVTGTMQAYINGVKNNIENFVEALRTRGIEYRLGLVLFSDIIEEVHQPTTDVKEFLSWLNKVFASGGFDEKENALEAIREGMEMRWNPAASKVLVLVTDAPYHQFGEKGNGRTYLNTDIVIEQLQKSKVRLFCITVPGLAGYKQMSDETNGAVYDIRTSFSRILDQYSTQLTNLYAISYRTDAKVMKDSINVSILDERKRQLIKQLIPIVEIGRKFIIENLLFPTNSAELSQSVEELDVLAEFMEKRPTMRVQIEGHTDNIGSAQLNMTLSERRAESVKAYLVRKGIKQDRIKTVGYGLTRPISTNTTEFGRSLNRRTEIVITQK